MIIMRVSTRPARIAAPVAVLALCAACGSPAPRQGPSGRATGHLVQAEHETASLRARIGAIAASVPRHRAPVTYYWELDQTYYSLTSSTFVGRLLGLLGMKSIADQAKGAAAAGGYPQLSS